MLHVRQNTSNPMPGEILNAPAPPRSTALAARTLPKSLLYSIFARIGGSGLDTDAFETLRLVSRRIPGQGSRLWQPAERNSQLAHPFAALASGTAYFLS